MKIWWPLPCRPSFSPRDTQGRDRGLKTYKYTLTVVDVASHCKEAEPLTSKDSDEVASALHKIYKWPLKWPQLLQVDPGLEVIGPATKEMEKRKKKKKNIRGGRTKIHLDQAVVKRYNRTLAMRLGHQYAVEMLLPES